MSNVLGNYNPTFFANEALDQLFKALGFAGRVYRGIEEERANAGRNLGDTVNLRRPGKFTAQDFVPGVGTGAQDLAGQNVQIQLNSHKEVKFKVTDRELAYSSERIINEHIKPAAYALADKIDTDLHAMGDRVGPKTFITATDSTAITKPRKVLRKNQAPLDDNIHYLVDSGMEAAFLDSPIFHQANTTGQGTNLEALLMGSLGRRFGVEVFATQNADVQPAVMSSTASASAGAGDRLGAVTADTAVNSAVLPTGSFTAAQTLQVGDTLTIAGDETIYILLAGATVDAGGLASLSIYPALRKNISNGSIITVDKLDAVQEAAYYRNLMFHKNAFALAFAPLPTIGDGKGAMIDTVTDEITGLSVRARMYYNGDTATNSVALDCLYGMQVLNGQMATRVHRALTLATS